jgi:hypothetical protein
MAMTMTREAWNWNFDLQKEMKYKGAWQMILWIRLVLVERISLTLPFYIILEFSPEEKKEEERNPCHTDIFMQYFVSWTIHFNMDMDIVRHMYCRVHELWFHFYICTSCLPHSDQAQPQCEFGSRVKNQSENSCDHSKKINMFSIPLVETLSFSSGIIYVLKSVSGLWVVRSFDLIWIIPVVP